MSTIRWYHDPISPFTCLHPFNPLHARRGRYLRPASDAARGELPRAYPTPAR